MRRTGLKIRSFRRGRLSEQVVVELEKMVAEQYQEGQVLPKEADLADHFGVSRIVIREAVKMLEERGVLGVRAGSGTFVISPSSEQVRECLLRLLRSQPTPTIADFELLMEVREILEESAARLAAVRANADDLAEIYSAVAMMAEKGEQSADGDVRFHRALARAAHNRYLEMILEPLTAAVRQQIVLTNSYSIGIDLHRAVADEIRKGSVVGARQAVRRLMNRTLADTRKAFDLIGAQMGESNA